MAKMVGRAGHGDAVGRQIEVMRKDFERQREEDVRERGRRFAVLEEVVRRQKQEMEEMKKELASCYR